MNQSRLLFVSIVILVVLLNSACSSQPIQQPQPAPSATLVLTVISQPEVSTSLPAESTPLTAIQTATEPPAGGGIVQVAPDTPPGPSVGAEKTITLDDRGKTISLAVGENFLLKLGESYNWDISISDESVIGRVRNITVIRGAQGIYDALKPGTAVLTANGDPLCRQAQPACAMPSILFEVTVVVK